MPTRNVVLTDEQSAMIERLVGSGRYQNASEVLRDGLRLVEQRDREEEAKLEALRAAAQVGIADIEAGRYRTFRSMDDLQEALDRMADEALGQAEAIQAIAASAKLLDCRAGQGRLAMTAPNTARKRR